MGYYINPSTESKEQFLSREGIKPTSMEQFKDFERRPEGTIPVVLVDNFIFTAAGIAYSPRELADFLDPDTRPREFYYVPIQKLIELHDYLGEVLR